MNRNPDAATAKGASPLGPMPPSATGNPLAALLAHIIRAGGNSPAPAVDLAPTAAQVRTWAKDTAFPAVRLNSMRRAELLDYARGLLCPIKNGMS